MFFKQANLQAKQITTSKSGGSHLAPKKKKYNDDDDGYQILPEGQVYICHLKLCFGLTQIIQYILKSKPYYMWGKSELYCAMVNQDRHSK